jgi:hypothetical protein
MEILGARISGQGQAFQIVVVKKYVVDNLIEARRAMEHFSKKYFPDVPVVFNGTGLKRTCEVCWQTGYSKLGKYF